MKPTQTFNDGVVGVYRVTDSSATGCMPTDSITLVHLLRYKEKTVGMNRFYTAMQNGIKVRYVLRCPLIRSVTTQDIAIPNDCKQYSIVQIQVPEDVNPPVMDLTLEEVVAKYEIV